MGNKEPTNAEIFALLKEIKGDINTIKQDLNSTTQKLENKIKELETENSVLKARFLSTERKIRKNNCLIFGVKINEEASTLEAVLKVFHEKLGVAISERDINNCYQLKHIREKPILLEFISYLKKGEIYNNLSKLKNTGIYFSDDLVYEDRQERKQLLEYMKKAKSNNLHTKIKKNKLLIAGETYTLTDLKNLDSEDLLTLNSIPGSDSEAETNTGYINNVNYTRGKQATTTANSGIVQSEAALKTRKESKKPQKIVTRNQLRDILK